MMEHSELISEGNFHYRVIAMYFFDETPASTAGAQMFESSKELKKSLGIQSGFVNDSVAFVL